jgi:hypothetical protein
MHPSTPRQRRAHVHAPSLSAASLLHSAASYSRAMTSAHKAVLVIILSLVLIWSATTGGGGGSGGGDGGRSAAAAIGAATATGMSAAARAPERAFLLVLGEFISFFGG